MATNKSNKIKLTDVVKSYDGEGDIAEWWTRFEIIAKLQSYTGEDMVSLIPLLLQGPPFLIYEKLSDDDKKDLDVIKRKLLTAFSLSKYAAYEQLRNRLYVPGENIDAYFSDIKRLSDLAGMGGAEVAFVVGLPEQISMQLRVLSDANAETLVARARVMIEAEKNKNIHESYVAAGIPQRRRLYNKDDRFCDLCKKAGHDTDKCWSRGNGKPTCFRCGQEGHVAIGCKNPRMSGKDKGAVIYVEPITTPSKS